MQAKNIPLEERIIFALDVADSVQAKALVRRLESEVRFFKVGLQLFLSGGFDIVDWIMGEGHRVMLDLKFYDIPKTVELAVDQLNGRGITFATVHGNRAIMEAAAGTAKDVGILAVTVLTSLGQNEIQELGAEISIEELVMKRAEAARAAGCAGIVCSPREASAVRKKAGPEMVIVTPGIRPSETRDSAPDDQVRIATPYSAITGGSDYLVIGRPLRDSPDPVTTAQAIKEEIARGLEEINR